MEITLGGTLADILGISHIHTVRLMDNRNMQKPFHMICQRWNRISDSVQVFLFLWSDLTLLRFLHGKAHF